LGEHFFLFRKVLRGTPLETSSIFISLETSALETYLGSNNSKSLPEEVIANSRLTDSSSPQMLVVKFQTLAALILVEPEDIAQAIIWILSEDSSKASGSLKADCFETLPL